MSAADKEDVRSELLQDRRELTAEHIAVAREQLRRHVIAEAGRAGWECVAAYVPLQTEPGSLQLLDALAGAGVRVLVPIVRDDRDLDWTEWGGPERPLGVGAIGEADAVLVPALAVSTDGTRLGRGGGSYDRALPRVRPGVPIVALLYSEEVRAELPREPWDVPVTGYVTPDGWHPIGRGNS